MAMDTQTLTAETGRPTGSRVARRLRAEGKVPGVVYGQGQDNVAIAVEWSELRRALTTEAGLNALINLQIDGDEQLSIVKELQRDPVRRDVTHVDFIRISRTEAIEVEVPIILEGHAEKVEREDGTVSHILFALPIKARPDAIPPELTLDVSEMEVGDSIRVIDLSLPEGVSTEVDPEEVVVTAQISRATIEVAEEEELAEALDELAEAEAAAAEGEEGAEGAPPAEGDEGGGGDQESGGDSEG